MTDNPIRTERRGHVLEVTLDRPKANAIDLQTSRIMGEAFRAFRDDPELRVAVITGAGTLLTAGWSGSGRLGRRTAEPEGPDARFLDPRLRGNLQAAVCR